MKSKKLTILLFLLLPYSFLMSKEVETTLRTSQRDEITIKYDVKNEDGKLRITFNDLRRRLSPSNREKIVKVMFFDRNNLQNDFYKFKGLTPRVIRVPGTMEYSPSDDGFFFLQKDLQLTVDLLPGAGDETLDIPIYLVEYIEKKDLPLIKTKSKSTLDVFAACTDMLSITVPKQRAGSSPLSQNTERSLRTVTDQIVVEEELETSMSAEDEAKILLTRADEYLTGNCDVDDVNNVIHQLENVETKVSNAGLRARIRQAADLLRQKRKDLQDAPTIRIEREKDALREEADRVMSKVKKLRDEQNEVPFSKELEEALDELNTVRKKARDLGDVGLTEDIAEVKASCETKKNEITTAKDKKRTIWMIIGGAILAVVVFIGNQIFQSFRSARLLRNTQDDIANRVKRDAQQRAASAVRSRISRVEGDIRRKSRDAVRSNIDGLVKGTMKGKKNVKI